MKKPAASLILGTAVLMAVAACAPPVETPPFQVVATMEELMDHVITPAAAVYWGAVSVVIDRDGVHENFPRNDREWEQVVGSALALAESSNLLLLASRAPDGDEWTRLSVELGRVAVEAAQAARRRDVDAVFEMGERIYNACSACHEQYLVDPAALTFSPED